MATALGLATALGAVGAVALLYHRHRRRPRPSGTAWLIGLLCFAGGVVLQLLAELGLHGPLPYRLWYLLGAFFSAAYLGMGSLYLVLPPRLAGWMMRGLVWASLLVAPTVLTAPVAMDRVDPRLLTGDGLPQYVRLLTPAFNLFGTAGLVGVALWSAWCLVRAGALGAGDPALRGRLVSVTCIAAGASSAAAGGALLRAGLPDAFYLSQLLAVGFFCAGLAPPFGGNSGRR